MKKPFLLPVWAPRLKPYLFRRLYESDAQGYLDIELLDKVGWALYSRCDSFLLAHEAKQGRVKCPVCRKVVLHTSQVKEMMHCCSCGWECTFQAYLATIKNQQLDGGPEVIDLIQKYVDKFPTAKEPADGIIFCRIYPLDH